jgi:GntR family transcriptional regulator
MVNAFDLKLDPRSPAPLYRQIFEQVRRLLALGALTPGDRFLTVRELSARTRVNRNTAARAVVELERAGVVRTRVGQGTFIADTASARATEDRDAVLDAAIAALLVEAHALAIPLEELGWRVQRKIEQFARARGDRQRVG